MANKDYRKEFICSMYPEYWNSISRSMDSVWKVIAPLTVIGTIISAMYKDFLPAFVGFGLCFIILFWALNMTIDLNAWHRRNLFFLSKIEKYFLEKEDYGNLLPVAYMRSKQGWITIYKINMWTFAILLLAICIMFAVYYHCNPELNLLLVPFLLFFVGCCLTIYNYYKQEKSARERFDELFP